MMYNKDKTLENISQDVVLVYSHDLKKIVHCNTVLNCVTIYYCIFSHDSDNLMIVMLSVII